MAKRHYRRLAPAAGLEDFGVSHVTLEPGGISSQRHWHEGEDEFVVMLAGEAVLVDVGVPMGPVIASIHERRDALQASIKAMAPEAEVRVLGRRRMRDGR